jgi:anti-anti-sigma regulatory factor
MTVQVLDGLKLNVDRGPNWLFVKLQPKNGFASELPELADRLMAMAAQHFTYRIVLELDELRSMPGAMIEQLRVLHDRLAECGGALRLCGLTAKCAETLRKCDLESVLPNHATRQEAVLGSEIAALRQKLKEVAASAGNDGADLVDSTRIWQQPCLQ